MTNRYQQTFTPQLRRPQQRTSWQGGGVNDLFNVTTLMTGKDPQWLNTQNLPPGEASWREVRLLKQTQASSEANVFM